MSVEERIRRIGTKTIAYPWLRRYVVIGPYNRRVRHEAAASVLIVVVGRAPKTASFLRRRRKAGEPTG